MKFIKKKHHRYLGILITLFGWALMSLQISCVKIASKNTPAFVIFFFQFIIVSVITFFIISLKGIHFIIPKNKYMVFFRGFISILGFFAFVFSGLLTSLTDASLLINTEALFVPILLLIFFKKNISLLTWIGMIIGFIGVIVVCPPDNNILNFGAIIGIFSGLATAIVITITKRLIKTDPAIRLTFYYAILGVIFSGILASLNWKTPEKHTLIFIIAAGVFLTLSMFLLIYAFNYAESFILGGLSYSLIIFSGLLEWIVWRKTPDMGSFIGFILITCGGFLIIYKNRLLPPSDST